MHPVFIDFFFMMLSTATKKEGSSAESVGQRIECSLTPAPLPMGEGVSRSHPTDSAEELKRKAPDVFTSGA